jgi:hypothetical protein
MRGGLASKSADRLSGVVLVTGALMAIGVVCLVALPLAMSNPFPTAHQGDWVIEKALAQSSVALNVAPTPAPTRDETTIVKTTVPTRSLTIATMTPPPRPAPVRTRRSLDHLVFAARWKRTGLPASDNANDAPTGTVRLALADEGTPILAAPKPARLEVPSEATRIKPVERKVEAPPVKKRDVNPMQAVDDYLWDVYERAPVKKDNTGDFTWKDVAAAKRMHMSLKDYVIRGMDPDFREELYHAGHAMDAAGLRWSMLSAFRDDYRQTLASGFKARTGNSLHGGSRAVGGYGHGRAVDLNNVDGDDETVWHWMDAHGAKYGLRRPMPGIDPAHIQSGGNWHEIAQAMRADRTRTAETKKPDAQASVRSRHSRAHM